MREIRKYIQGYEGLYQVSSYGNIRSLNRTIHNGHVLRGINIKLYANNRGYYIFTLPRLNNRKRKTVAVHRLVALHFIDNPNSKKIVNHIDGNKTNNNVNNLERVTNRENCEHCWYVLGKGKIPKNS